MNDEYILINEAANGRLVYYPAGCRDIHWTTLQLSDATRDWFGKQYNGTNKVNNET